jgi:hypothetical protein
MRDNDQEEFQNVLYNLCIFLLRHGADTDIGHERENCSWKVIHFACSMGNMPLLQALLDQCLSSTIPIDRRIFAVTSFTSESAISAALGKVHFLATIKMLVEYGVDINSPCWAGKKHIPSLHPSFSKYWLS